jgi:hypothetical protein
VAAVASTESENDSKPIDFALAKSSFAGGGIDCRDRFKLPVVNE